MPIFADITLPFSQYFQKLPLPRYCRFRRARERLESVIYRMIEERRRVQPLHRSA